MWWQNKGKRNEDNEQEVQKPVEVRVEDKPVIVPQEVMNKDGNEVVNRDPIKKSNSMGRIYAPAPIFVPVMRKESEVCVPNSMPQQP